MIAPGCYSQECNVHKPCPDPTKYCQMFLCVDCQKENVACTQNGQCCPGTECTYGRCKKGSSKGVAGNCCFYPAEANMTSKQVYLFYRPTFVITANKL